MRAMKPIVSVLAVLATLLLAACGNGGSSVDKNDLRIKAGDASEQLIRYCIASVKYERAAMHAMDTQDDDDIIAAGDAPDGTIVSPATDKLLDIYKESGKDDDVREAARGAADTLRGCGSDEVAHAAASRIDAALD
jgi:hypothetical protein